MSTNRRETVEDVFTRLSEDLSSRAYSPPTERRGTITIRDPSAARPSVDTSGRPVRPRMPPRDRFRSAVRRLIAVNRSYQVMSHGIGAEPGINPKLKSSIAAFGRIHAHCQIDVIDYSSIRFEKKRMANAEFLEFLDKPREPWVKVRWINVGGVSWDVIHDLAIKYDLHPLAIENMLQTRRHDRSKADYFQQHLFLRVLRHTLVAEDPQDDECLVTDALRGIEIPRSASPSPIEPREELLPQNGTNREQAGLVRRSVSMLGTRKVTMTKKMTYPPPETPEPSSTLQRTLSFNTQVTSNRDARNLKIIQELLKGQRVNVKIDPVCIFLFRDGTVISIHHDKSLESTAPITARLASAGGVLRSTPDASLLVQSLLDLVVDEALRIVNEYESRILKLEKAVLSKPQVKHVVRLHALQGDLILHRRTLSPLQRLVFSLRRYDADHVAAISDGNIDQREVEGFLSAKAKTYLADVHDHMEFTLSALDMYAGVTKNLMDYTFNMASHDMSEVMRRLTIATIIFLPLTVLAGYFGMNFDRQWSWHHGHSDVIYWIIALPLLAILIPAFLWGDINRLRHDAKKYMAARALKQMYK